MTLLPQERKKLSVTDDRFIPYDEALSGEGESLDRVRERLQEQHRDLMEIGRAARPVFVGIGASHAASALAVYLLRRRGVPAHRVSAGDLPAGTPALGDAVIGVSQSGRWGCATPAAAELSAASGSCAGLPAAVLLGADVSAAEYSAACRCAAPLWRAGGAELTQTHDPVGALQAHQAWSSRLSG